MTTGRSRRATLLFMVGAIMAQAADSLPQPPAGAGSPAVKVYMTVAALERKSGKAPQHYHTWADCGLLHPDAQKVRMMSESDARAHGYTLCLRCAKRANAGPVNSYQGWTRPVTEDQLRDAKEGR